MHFFLLVLLLASPALSIPVGNAVHDVSSPPPELDASATTAVTPPPMEDCTWDGDYPDERCVCVNHKSVKDWGEDVVYKPVKSWGEGVYKPVKSWSEGVYKPVKSWSEEVYKPVESWSKGMFSHAGCSLGFGDCSTESPIESLTESITNSTTEISTEPRSESTSALESNSKSTGSIQSNAANASTPIFSLANCDRNGTNSDEYCVCVKSADCWLAIGGWALAGFVAFFLALPLFLLTLGFGAIGIVEGSLAALCQSRYGTPCFFRLAQSAAMSGRSLICLPFVFQVPFALLGAAVGGLLAGNLAPQCKGVLWEVEMK